MPESARKTFVEMAGGKEGRLVRPSARTEAEPLKCVAEEWKTLEPKQVDVVRLAGDEPTSAAEALELLKQAGGAWLDDESPDRLFAALHETDLGRELAAVLERGGAVGLLVRQRRPCCRRGVFRKTTRRSRRPV